MTKLIPIYADFETYWDAEHTLSKMNAVDYVQHPKTEIISLAIKYDKYPVDVFFGEADIQAALDKIDWSDKILIGHNMSGFDAMIFAWRFGIKPKMWGCTLAMARPIHAKGPGGSLKALVNHYGLPSKGSLDATNTKGKHLADFTPAEREAMKDYNALDTSLCAILFSILLPLTSRDEMRLIDMTVRMLVEPQFEVDRDLLTSTLASEKANQRKALLDLAGAFGATSMNSDQAEAHVRTILASAGMFTEFLKAQRVPVPMKPSPSDPNKMIPALAKTDQGLLDLLEHENPLVASAARARLGVKSVLLETRIEAFLRASGPTGKLPVPINYYGADTTGRDSGWAYNPQNLPRVSGKPSDCLRNSLRAPKGHKIIVADLSGIELRVNMFLWKVPYAMALFKADPHKADLYKALASEVLGVPIEGMPKMVRQAGKAMHLGCGFGLGSEDKYIAVAKTMAGIDVTETEAATHIAGYRRKHPEIVQGWRTCHGSLMSIYQGVEEPIDPWGLCTTCAEGIKTPTGMIRYPDLRQVYNDERLEWVYAQGRNQARIYAGKVTENIVQHLARNVIMGNALQFRKDTGYSPALRVHDELVYVVPEKDAVELLQHLQSIMCTPPTWWPELITSSEGDIADTYGEAK